MLELKQKVVELYNERKTIKEISIILNIPKWKCYEIKQKSQLPTIEQWQRVGMPKKFNKYTREILFGTLLGDASLDLAGQCKYRKLKISHSPKQKDYLSWLREQIIELKPSGVRPANDKWGTLNIYTPPHPEFNKIYNMCYPNGKQITALWLKELTPLSLAVWYMDDGGSQSSYNIATCAFSLESHHLIRSFMLKKWDINITIRNNDYPRISFDKENASKFKSLIENYIIPSMKYKLDLKTYNPEERRQKYLRTKLIHQRL